MYPQRSVMTCGLATALEPPHFNHAPVDDRRDTRGTSGGITGDAVVRPETVRCNGVAQCEMRRGPERPPFLSGWSGIRWRRGALRREAAGRWPRAHRAAGSGLLCPDLRRRGRGRSPADLRRRAPGMQRQCGAFHFGNNHGRSGPGRQRQPSGAYP